MADFVTVFEIGRLSNGVWAETVIRLVIGIVALVIGAALFVRSCRAKSGRLAGCLCSLLVVGWGVFWLVMGDFPSMFARISRLVAAYEKREYQVVEGDVQVLRQQPAHGHSSGDVIVVNGVRFEVDYFFFTPAYRDTIAHGGALKPGVYARLYYTNGSILRVDIRKGA